MIAAAVAVAALLTVGAGVWWVRLAESVRAARRAAADAMERRSNVLETVGDGIYILDGDLRVTHVNAEAERLLRVAAGALVGRALHSIVDPLASELLPDVRYARRTGDVVERTHAFAATRTWVEVRVKPAAGETLISLRDVTERTLAETQLRENEQRLRLVTQNVDAVLWTTDRDARFTAIAGGALGELGLRADELIDAPCEPLLAERVLRDALAGESVRTVTARGDRWLRHHVEPLRDAEQRIVGAVAVSIDITELKRTQQQLYDSAHRDGLTGLPNRLSFDQHLTAQLASASASDGRFALMYVDLDRFKTINDTLGHGVGDLVLREVAWRLRESLPAHDIVARPGGDELIVLLPNAAHRGDADRTAQHLMKVLREPLSVRGRELHVSASAGVALFPEHGRDAEALVAHADAAMYRAKGAGGNRYAVYDGSIEAAASDRLALENDLWHALARNELRPLYQPIVDIATRRVAGCEALVRWDHPTRGVVEPGDFIAIAEQTGTIVALDRWMLREACGLAVRMRRHAPEFRISVNLSPRDLREADLPDVVAAILAEHRLPAGALTIEVTEHVVLDDAVLPALRRLCALGVRVEVDDFGVGYSSLAYLKRLPVTGLKIDRAFIADLAHDAYDQAIVGSVMAVAKALGLHVTAEGIETPSQLELLAELGCDEAQGYLFAPPLSAGALERMLVATPALRLAHARG
jgi:diguanylate cyclase (GGDEF)-like protein/PAS domain S-box-containing protein